MTYTVTYTIREIEMKNGNYFDAKREATQNIIEGFAVIDAIFAAQRRYGLDKEVTRILYEDLKREGIQ